MKEAHYSRLRTPRGMLSSRQADILTEVAVVGGTHKEIAKRLGIASSTVAKHLSVAFVNLRVKGIETAAYTATIRGLIKHPKIADMLASQNRINIFTSDEIAAIKSYVDRLQSTPTRRYKNKSWYKPTLLAATKRLGITPVMAALLYQQSRLEQPTIKVKENLQPRMDIFSAKGAIHDSFEKSSFDQEYEPNPVEIISH